MRILGSDTEAAARRERGLKLYAAGATASAIEKKLRVNLHTVRRWIRNSKSGVAQQRLPKGPSPLLSKDQIEKLKSELKRGAFAHGYSEDYWTLDRIAHLIWH